MKYRVGFVTNSSSSSYICTFCGDVQSGWDMSLSEAEMYECVNGHMLCEYHFEDDLDIEKKGEIVLVALKDNIKNAEDIEADQKLHHLKEWADEKAKYSEEKIKELEEKGTDEDLVLELFEDLDIRYNLPEKHCPICTFEALDEFDALNYLMKKYEVKLNDLQSEIRDKFTSYKEFREHLRR